MGRPTDYSESLVDKICEQIASGRSLRSISEDEGMPNEKTIYKWILKYPEFNQKYTTAREAQADFYAEQIIEIADNSTDDIEMIETEHGLRADIKHSAINRARLQIDTRKWLAGKLRPKKYGDKLNVDADVKHQFEPLVIKPLVMDANKQIARDVTPIIENVIIDHVAETNG